MSAQLATFNFEGTAPIRTVIRDDGEPWVVAKDAALALGYPESTVRAMKRTVQHVPDEWRGLYPIQTPSGVQEMVVLSEAGLFFFLARSDKPKALPFQKWLAGEVLPAIRRAGRYELPGHMAANYTPMAASTFKNSLAILGELDGVPEAVEHIRKHSAGAYRNTKEISEQVALLTRTVTQLVELERLRMANRTAPPPAAPAPGDEEAGLEAKGFIRCQEAARRLGVLPSFLWGACKHYGIPRQKTRHGFKLVHWEGARDFLLAGKMALPQENGPLLAGTM